MSLHNGKKLTVVFDNLQLEDICTKDKIVWENPERPFCG